MRTIRHVALVADTHGHLDDRVGAIARACDLVVHAGDVGGTAILDALAGDGDRPLTVAGNNDTPRHWPAADRAVLDGLPQECAIELPGGRLVVVHGHRLPARTRHRRLRRAHPDATAVVVGHSHRRVIDRDQHPWILNPGAAGRSRAHGGPGCLVLAVGHAGWSVTEHAFEPRPRRR